MESSQITEAFTGRRRAGIRQRLRAFHLGHPTLLQLVLALAAFVFGVAISAVVFVGIWRHAASRRDEARAAQASAVHRLARARVIVKRLEADLAAQRTLLGRARRREAALRKEERELALSLAAARRTSGLVASRLPGQLAAVSGTAAELARQSSLLASNLTGMEAYLSSSSGASIDPGFLSTQIRYLTGAIRSAQGKASELRSEVAAASETAAVLDGAN